QVPPASQRAEHAPNEAMSVESEASLLALGVGDNSVPAQRVLRAAQGRAPKGFGQGFRHDGLAQGGILISLEIEHEEPMVNQAAWARRLIKERRRRPYS